MYISTVLIQLCYVTVELSNTQLALQGTQTEGFVLVTSALSRILNCEHKPQWREGDLRIKKSWVAKVEEMQVSNTWCVRLVLLGCSTALSKCVIMCLIFDFIF